MLYATIMELYIYTLFPYSIPLCFHENLTSTSQVKLSPATKPQSPPTPPPPPVKENPREPGELPKPQSAIPGGFADFSDLSDFHMVCISTRSEESIKTFFGFSWDI
jgi:hypothetical protein